MSATRSDVCVVACAEAFRGDGEILASPIGVVPTLGARLAALTFAPDLVYSDGDAAQLGAPISVNAAPQEPRVIEAWLPFARMFDIVWSGRRHVMMGATQIDRFGNQNIACIGPWAQPKSQLLGVRGAPGNTVNHPTSYWIPKHDLRSFVEKVDCVSGVGYDRAAAAGPSASEFHEIRRVVTNLAVLDFETPDNSMRLRSVHPGVSVSEVVAATGFALVQPDVVPETRSPTGEELALLDSVLDPDKMRATEVSS
ncbi:CoA-transferase [Actinomycetes bacterium]|nr:CoA-transferase [Actinomycetes bacterium]